MARPNWKCNLCSRFLSSNSIKLHKTFRKCKKCGLKLACGGKAAKHILQCQGKEHKEIKRDKIAVKWNECDKCGDFYSSAKSHFGTASTCYKCKVRFACRGQCLEHQRLKCCKVFICNFCGLFCVTKSRLETHAKERNCSNCDHISCCFNLYNGHECEESDEEKITEEENLPVLAEEPVVNPLLIKNCAFCNHLCNSAEEFECHTRKIDCPRCGFAQPCNTLLAHHLNVCRFEQGESEKFQCGECEKVFPKRNKLESHMRRRHVQRSSILEDAKTIFGMMEKKITETAEMNIINRLFVKKEHIPVVSIDD
ncbi:PR domain zinc finger protein 5-like [Neocloeon triangulifer]|uniref:PR domain zinc finger protein 5-like n=1 Tax=Neocloeon triangulifer TaxID=2078957 RepID=UPI00286F9260|nr:PR domain zinc finger protein 5-like [Neocloeon triangulifer]